MSFLQLVVVLIVVGFGLWLINNYMPMDAKIKKILNIVVVVIVVLFVLSEIGLMDPILRIRVGR
jgi:hypothetical protein